MQDAEHEGNRGRDDRQAKIIENDVVLQIDAEQFPAEDIVQAILAAGIGGELVDDEIDDLREGKGDHREIDAFLLRDDEAEQQAHPRAAATPPRKPIQLGAPNFATSTPVA